MFYSILILRLFQTLRLLSEGVTFHIQQMERSDDRSSQMQMFFKGLSLVCKLLSNAGGLWSVFLPLSAHKLVNEVVEKVRG